MVIVDIITPYFRQYNDIEVQAQHF